MAVTPYIAGGYTVTYNALSLGNTDEGINHEFSLNGEPIRADNMADAMQDMVLRGGDMYLDMVLAEFGTLENNNAKGAFWHMSSTWGKYDNAMIGRLAVGADDANSIAKTLIMTRIIAIGGGGVEQTVPATMTYKRVILAPNYPVRMLFAPRLRRVPIRFQVFPYTDVADSNAKKYFTST